MRTFTIGGAAQLTDQSFMESNSDGEVKIRNRNLARNANGDLMAMARSAVVITDRRRGRARVRQYGARLKVETSDKIKHSQRSPMGSVHSADPDRNRRRDRVRGR